MAHPIRDSSSDGKSEVLRSLYNLMAFEGRSGVSPAHVAVDLRRRSLTPDPNLETEVVRVHQGLRDDGLITGGHTLRSIVRLTKAGVTQGRNPIPPAIVGGQGDIQAWSNHG